MKRFAAAGALLCACIGVHLAVAGSANAGVYYVVKCHSAYYPADEVNRAGRHPSYRDINDCTPKVPDYKLGIVNIGAASNNAYSQYMFTAPPGTILDGVCLQHKLRRDSHHRAELTAFPGFPLLAAGGDGPSGWTGTRCYDLDHQQFIVRMFCNRAGGCAEGPHAHAYVRNIELQLRDEIRPQITRLGGALWSSGGWHRGVAELDAASADPGAGHYHSVAYVNGAQVGRSDSGCAATGLTWPRTVRLAPCPFEGRSLQLRLATDHHPFVNGTNVVQVYVADFAANTVTQTRVVKVDNLAPQAAFTNSQDPDDPELIRASVSDAHSGVRRAEILFRPVGGVSWHPLQTRIESGEALARVDSASLPPGDYEFKAEVVDVAGNETSTLLRKNGTPMRLSFPLRIATELQAGIGKGKTSRETVPYGTSSTVRGRLVDASGQPIANREVVVTENFGEGALIRERPTSVVTDTDGKFKTKIPAGPSRTIEVGYAGSPKHLPTSAEVGEFKVRSRVSLRTSRKTVPEGGAVSFKGRIRHFGARIPPGGKLAELQVRVRAGRWDTVKEAFRTSAGGKFRLRYRFGRHYVSDALFRFRVKVQKEGGWPFERATSRQRRIIVRAR